MTALDRIWHAVRRRPVRVAEAVFALLAALGYAVHPDVQGEVVVLIGAVVALFEVAQTKTTPTAEPILPDGHADEADHA